ncbi:TonB-dependent receptor [Niastella yeongjuensis]|nr:TonB-dependent receptor [Niastella yeongjuensis]
MKASFLAMLLGLVMSIAHAQPCTLTVTGHVVDIDTREHISTVSVHIRERNISFLSNQDGLFTIDSLCRGTYTVIIKGPGFDSLTAVIKADSSMEQTFFLMHTGKALSQVEVVGQRKQGIATNAHTDIKMLALFQTRGATLGESLKGVPGLNSIQTGPSISKPVIHGLHSNRLLILNNGVKQEGQQWGSEHAPEIDPFIANKITIIKGASSVRYGSDAIVGVVLVEPKTLSSEKKLQGDVNAVAGSNGRVGTLSGLLEGKFSDKPYGVNWRVQGTLKQAGNFKTANYYLKNTGLREGDFSLATNYKSKQNNLGAEVYYSEFHNKVGIFEGSHVGNVNDLYAAFARTKPLTASYFSYDIARTYQQITHDLLKVTAFYKLKNGDRIEAQYSHQKNKRDEYDIDFPYSTDPEILKRPQISFQIKTDALDLSYQQENKNHFSGLFGISGATQGNVFKGIRYLVPNFRNYSGGVFAIEKYSKNNWLLEAGIRYDYRWLRVYKLNNNTLETYNTTTNYRNITGTIGSTYSFSNHFSVSANVGSAWRAPSVNELYINGIHLSAASYEKGDSSLQSERSYNFTISSKYETDRFYAEVVLYNNIINNFIYAKPALTPITLVSGTYPLFNYTQADVNMKGLDAELRYSLLKKLSVDAKVSLVRAWNKTIHDYLLFMPADRFVNSLKYDIGSWKRVQHWYISGEVVTVLQQKRTPPNSDYVQPPKGYTLLNANTGFEWYSGKHPLHIELAAYNLTNVAYRDYLNRFRYYADDLGLNVVLRMKYMF